MSKKIISPFEFAGDINDIKQDIKAAITEKGVDMTDVVRFSEYPDKIREIGGGQPDADAELVTFYDYDGTIIKSYTVDEFAKVTELPSPPIHDRLTFQGWNWSLADIKAMGRAVDVGATYVTSSGKSEFDLTVNAVTGFDVTMRFYNVTAGNTITVDWGDGTSDNSPTTTVGGKVFTHTYSAAGNYTATVDNTGGYYPHYTSSPPFNMFDKSPSYICTAVRLGGRCTEIGEQAFAGCRSLSSIVISESVTSIGNATFGNCHSLTNIVLPNSLTTINASMFVNCYSLTNAVLPGSVTAIGYYAFNNCYSLASIVLPNSLTTIGNAMFNNCYSLTNIVLPNSLTSIDPQPFNSCYSLTNVVIPTSVTLISDAAFISCYAIKKYKLLPSTPPVLGNTNAFADINQICIIEVPKGSLEAYQTATNWSTYAAYMRESE